MATYYVKAAGGTGSGADDANAWSFAHLLTQWANINPGDTVLFKGGDTFYGTLTIPEGGTTGNLLTFGAYGTGKPIFTGFNTISAWTAHATKANCWVSTNAVTTLASVEMLTIDGVQFAPGRWPKTTWLTNGGSSTTTSLRGADILTTAPEGNWTNAYVVMRSNAYYYYSRKITSHTDSGGFGVLNWSTAVGAAPSTGYGFFFQHDPQLRTLSQHGDWYFDEATKKITIWTTLDPNSNYVIKVADLDNIISLTTSGYVTFDGLELQGSNSDAMVLGNRIPNPDTGGENITVNNCKIHFGGKDGIVARSSVNHNMTFTNNEIFNVNDFGIDARESSNNKLFENNHVYNIGLFLGHVPVDATRHKTGIETNGGTGQTFRYNHVHDCGYQGIRHNGHTILTEYNHVHHTCRFADDGAGIYAGDIPGAWTTHGKIIRYNLVHDVVGYPDGSSEGLNRANPIYMDESAEGWEIYGNYAWTAGKYCVYVHNAPYINIHDNWLFDGGKNPSYDKQGLIGFVLDSDILTNAKANANVCISKSVDQFVMNVQDNLSTGEGFFATDADLNNNWYCRPIRSTSDLSTETPFNYNPAVGGNVPKTFTEWKALFGWDANSTLVSTPSYAIGTNPDTVFDVFYNATSSPTTETLTRSYRDGKGNIYYAGDVELAPYTALFLIKSDDINPSIKPKIKGGKFLLRNGKIVV